MFIKQDLNLIVTVVARGFSDTVMAVAKSEGAEGATIISARGSDVNASDTVLGVSIQPEKEVVMILARKQLRKKIMRAICKECGLGSESKGICFSLPVDEVGGLSHQLLTKKPSQKPVAKPTPKDEQKPKEAKENSAQKAEEKAKEPIEKSKETTEKEKENKEEKTAEEKNK